jgi:hypothetical protein
MKAVANTAKAARRLAPRSVLGKNVLARTVANAP